MNVDKRLAFGIPKPDGSFDLLTATDVLSPERFAEYERIIRVVGELRPVIIDHLTLEFDFYALEDVEPRLATMFDGIHHPFGPIGIINVVALTKAQGALSNFLASCSAFRDRLTAKIVQRFGADSSQFQNWKAAQSKAFDESFAYRLFYGLRNYAQHHSAPIDLITINGKRNAEGAMEHQFTLALSREKLIAADQIKARLRKDLLEREERLDLMPLACQVMSVHRQFALDQMLSEEDRLAEMVALARHLMTKAGAPRGGVPFILEGGTPDPSVSQQRKVHSFSLDELALINLLRARLENANPPRVEINKDDWGF